MAKDPAFLFYPGDWLGGTQTFSRFLKGCYMDILMAQFNSGHLSLEEIKTVLGSDFGQSWPTIQKKFKIDPQGLFFNERLELEKQKRIEYSASRSKNREKKDMNNISRTHGKTYVKHMENGNRSENVNENWLKWSQLILNDEDWDWQQMRGRKIQQAEMNIFLSVAVRKDWKMESQQAFRISLNGFKVNGYKDEKILADLS
jgi:hypothetical protein